MRLASRLDCRNSAELSQVFRQSRWRNSKQCQLAESPDPRRSLASTIIQAPGFVMTNRLFVALVCVLFLVRLPSLAEPMGADQGLYAYIGDRILHGDMPYRDAWDQKPPAVHFAYALMRAAWPHEPVVAGADLLAALTIAWLLFALGSTVHTRAVGQIAALLFLFLSNPAFLRLSGVSVRAQCETFIAAAVTAALLLVARSRGRSAMWTLLAAGGLMGVGAVFKYNAAI